TRAAIRDSRCGRRHRPCDTPALGFEAGGRRLRRAGAYVDREAAVAPRPGSSTYPARGDRPRDGTRAARARHARASPAAPRACRRARLRGHTRERAESALALGVVLAERAPLLELASREDARFSS